jgi:hypothetical protein
LVLGLTAQYGGYYDGTRFSLIARPEWRASHLLRVTGEAQVDRISFPERNQEVDSRIFRLRAMVAPTTRLSVGVLAQTNSVADIAITNIRLRYNFREGHDLWAVYGHEANLDRRQPGGDVPLHANASLVIKYSRTYIPR